MCPSYMNFLEILFVIQVITLHLFWIFYQDFWGRNTRQGKKVMRLEAEDHTGSWWPPAARPRPLVSDWWAKLDLLLKQQRGTGAGWVGVPDSIPLKWWLFQGLETQVMQPNAPAVMRRRQRRHMPGRRQEESMGLYPKLEVLWTFSLKLVSWDEFNEHYLNKRTLSNIYSYCIDIHLIHSLKQEKNVNYGCCRLNAVKMSITLISMDCTVWGSMYKRKVKEEWGRVSTAQKAPLIVMVRPILGGWGMFDLCVWLARNRSS